MDICLLCGYCSLQTKTVIAGIAQFVTGLIGVIHLSVFTTDFENYLNCNVAEIITIIKSVLVGVISYFIFISMMSTLIISNCIKKNPSYIIPPIHMAAVNLIIDIIYSLIYVTILYNATYTLEMYVLMSWFFTGLISGIQFYLWLNIDSLYKKLMAEKLRYIVHHKSAYLVQKSMINLGT